MDKTISVLWGIVHGIERMNVTAKENTPVAEWTGAFKEAIRCVELVHKGEMV